MKTINLKELYPHYTQDVHVLVSDEIASVFEAYHRQEQTHIRRIYRYKAYVLLEQDLPAEYEASKCFLSPYEICERQCTLHDLHRALSQLPRIQAKRLYAYYFLDMSHLEIAVSEGISRTAVSTSIARGLNSLRRNFEFYSK